MNPVNRCIPLCLLSTLVALSGFAEQSRTISGTFPSRVEISIVPPEGTNAWSVEEVLTGEGVSVDLSGEGIFDEENGKAKWGPFLDDAPRVLSYHLTGPAGEVALDGIVSFDGTDEPVDTMDVVILPDPQTNFSGWRYLTLPGELLHTLGAHPLSDVNLDGFNLLQEYAFGLLVPEIQDGPVIIAVPGSSANPPDCNISYYRNRFAEDLVFTLHRHDPVNGWLPLDFESIGIMAEEFALGDTEKVSEVVFAGTPLTEVEGTFLQVQARLVEP
ncbi:MAG: hypothetical protein AB3N64_12325 [Puniceicoccaceae bacterium]